MAREKKFSASEFAGRGGNARAAKLTKEQRKEIARKAAQVRWAKQKGKFSRDTETIERITLKGRKRPAIATKASKAATEARKRKARERKKAPP